MDLTRIGKRLNRPSMNFVSTNWLEFNYILINDLVQPRKKYGPRNLASSEYQGIKPIL